MSIEELIEKTKARIAEVEADKQQFIERAVSVEYHRPTIKAELDTAYECDDLIYTLRNNLEQLEDKKLYQQHRKDCK